MNYRKGYTRAPFDDWRKPPTNDREEDGEGGGWRSSGTGPSGRRWNAPATSGSGGPPQGSCLKVFKKCLLSMLDPQKSFDSVTLINI